MEVSTSAARSAGTATTTWMAVVGEESTPSDPPCTSCTVARRTTRVTLPSAMPTAPAAGSATA